MQFVRTTTRLHQSTARARCAQTGTLSVPAATIPQPPRRCGSSSARDHSYTEDWYEQVRKPKEFYERCANGRPRRYFYNVDLRGRLFLEETVPKNAAASIKDEVFLDRFFSRIRRTGPGDLRLAGKSNAPEVPPGDYPFVSRCGPEINFVRPAATPIVFHSLVDGALLYGGSLRVPFETDRLVVSRVSGRLFYRISGGSGGNGFADGPAEAPATGLEYGLICSSVAVALSNRIDTGPDMDANHHSTQDTDLDDRFVYDGEGPIDWLPPGCEPGPWAMPDEPCG